MTHSRSLKEACRLLTRSGSAMFTIVMSSSSMKMPVQTTTSVHHFSLTFGMGLPSPGVAAWQRAIGTPRTAPARTDRLCRTVSRTR